MILRNYHTHTSYCDGKDSPEEIVKSAIADGFKTLGFSGHSHIDNENWTMSEEGTRAYHEEILILKEKYKSDIEILLGLEQDILSKPYEGNFDFIIGAVHGVNTPDGILYMDSTSDILKAGIEKYFDGDPMSLAEKYFELVGELSNRTDADIIAHFDLLTKFDEKETKPIFHADNPRYTAAAKNALKALSKSEKKPLIEINTGAMARGYRTTPYPSESLLKAIKEEGFDIVINSDCHQKDKLAFGFTDALALAKSCGFTRIAYLEQGKIQYEEI